MDDANIEPPVGDQCLIPDDNFHLFVLLVMNLEAICCTGMSVYICNLSEICWHIVNNSHVTWVSYSTCTFKTWDESYLNHQHGFSPAPCYFMRSKIEKLNSAPPASQFLSFQHLVSSCIILSQHLCLNFFSNDVTYRYPPDWVLIVTRVFDSVPTRIKIQWKIAMNIYFIIYVNIT